MRNLLIQGDNLAGLRLLINERCLCGKIDLIYIDPPFATGANFTVADDRASTISRVNDGEIAYSDVLKGQDYLIFLRERLILLRDLLSAQGSIYLHVDYKIGHYVKVLMDEIFGIKNFRNDITRVKCNPKNFSRVGYGNIKDMILFYTKTSNPIWHEPKIPFTQEDVERLYPKTDASGRAYTTVPIHAPGETKNGLTSLPFKGLLPPKGRHWRVDVPTLEEWDKRGLIEWSSSGNPRKKIFADEQQGKKVQDIWEFKDPQYPVYPTEKNLELLKLIVGASSDEDSVVLDCFCGSGTTLEAARSLGRSWIGIDRSPKAVETIKSRLGADQANLFESPVDFEFLELDVVGVV